MAQNYYFSANQNAKRLHGAPTGYLRMYSPRCHRVSHTMTNKKNTKKTSTALVRFQNVTTKGNKMRRNASSSSNAVIKPSTSGKPLYGGRTKTGKKANLPRFLIAQVDPFCPQAFDVKVPDENTAPSATAFSRSAGGFTTDANGLSVRIFRYHPKVATFAAATPASSTSWTFPAAFANAGTATNQGALATAFTMVRCCAFGVKLTTRQSYTAVNGLVHIAMFPQDDTLTTWSGPTSVAAMEYCPYYRRIPMSDLLTDEVLLNGKYTDATAFRYFSPNVQDVGASATNYPMQSSGWLDVMVVCETGSISTASVLDYELIQQWEGFTTAATSGIVEMSPAAPHSPAIMAATSQVVTLREPVATVAESKDDGGGFWKDVEQGFHTALDVASGVIGIGTKLAGLFGF